MIYLISNIVYLILYNVFVHCLVELPQVEDNNIGISERIIRDTVNNLFVAFRLRDVRNKHKLQQFSIIHNFFVSITLKDCNNLKKIARLTRVKNIDYNTQHFITQINEALDDDDTTDKATDDLVYLNAVIDIFIRRLKYLKMTHKLTEKKDINPNVIKHLLVNNNANLMINATKQRTKKIDHVLNSEEYWKASSRRIFQGHRIAVKHFPFLASIHIFEQFQCAGSIIKSDLVITSSSCLQLAWNNRLYRENPAFVSVRIGSRYTQRGGEEIPVLEIFFHPLYTPKTLEHNLAVMRLTRRIVFKTANVIRKIDIDRDPYALSESDIGHITVVGWGARDQTNLIHHPRKNTMAFAELEIYPFDDCQDSYTKSYVTKKHFCAGFISKGGGACNHDAGGPGIVHDKLMGVISFGAVSCGTLDSPTVFTKLGFYADWIDEIMDQNVPKTYRLQETIQKRPVPKRVTQEMPSTFTFSPLPRTTTTLSPYNIKDADFNMLLRNEDTLMSLVKYFFNFGDIGLNNSTSLTDRKKDAHKTTTAHKSKKKIRKFKSAHSGKKRIRKLKSARTRTTVQSTQVNIRSTAILEKVYDEHDDTITINKRTQASLKPKRERTNGDIIVIRSQQADFIRKSAQRYDAQERTETTKQTLILSPLTSFIKKRAEIIVTRPGYLVR